MRKLTSVAGLFLHLLVLTRSEIAFAGSARTATAECINKFLLAQDSTALKDLARIETKPIRLTGQKKSYWDVLKEAVLSGSEVRLYAQSNLPSGITRFGTVRGKIVSLKNNRGLWIDIEETDGSVVSVALDGIQESPVVLAKEPAPLFVKSVVADATSSVSTKASAKVIATTPADSRLDRLRRDPAGHPTFPFLRSDPRKLELAIQQFAEVDPSKRQMGRIFHSLYESGQNYELRFKLKNQKNVERSTIIREFRDYSGKIYNAGIARYDARVQRNYSDPVFILDGQIAVNLSVRDIDPKSLKIVPKKVPAWVQQSKSKFDLAEKAGILSVRHNLRGKLASQIQNLLKIVSDGKLDGASNHVEGELSANYLMLENNADHLVHNPNIALHFDTKLLNRTDYFLNHGWAFGNYSRASVRYDEDEILRPFMYHYGLGHLPGWDSHELVFMDVIGLEHLQNIYVPYGMREAILDQIHKLKLKPLNGRSWESIVVERAKDLPNS